MTEPDTAARERRAYIVAAARTRLSLTDEDLAALGMHDGAGRRVSRELALGILELNALLEAELAGSWAEETT